MVPLEYLHSLQDMSVVHEFEWDEHILLDAMREVKKYQDKRNEGKLKFHISGCLPMLPVIYMDHIDIPRGCIVDHSIDYSLPRVCFVKELDFTAVIANDTMEDGFGKRPLPPHMCAIFNKHKDIHAAELKEACIDDITEEAQVEVSSGRGHDQKHPTLELHLEPTRKVAKMKKKKLMQWMMRYTPRFDCGLFAILYMENLTAKGLKPFSTDTTSLLNFRKYIAAKLFKHPQNTLSSEEELQKLLKKS
ncbi:hypothetical protein ZWY2020_039155 [Hordeum vulgare]|nr:hypothetical protein ZWY2020_039155 [Hordeum vulgare]